MEELLELLEHVRPGVDFENEKFLLDGAVLNSFDVVMIIGELNEHYDIDISVDDILPENFNSAEAIYALVEDMQDRI